MSGTESRDACQRWAFGISRAKKALERKPQPGSVDTWGCRRAVTSTSDDTAPGDDTASGHDPAAWTVIPLGCAPVDPSGAPTDLLQATTGTTTSAAIDLLVTTLGTGVTDAARSQRRPVGPAAVALVAQHMIRAGPRPTTPRPRDPQPGHELPEQHGVVDVPGGHQQHQRPPAPSTSACTLPVRPPRDRPIPCSPDSATTGAEMP